MQSPRVAVVGQAEDAELLDRLASDVAELRLRARRSSSPPRSPGGGPKPGERRDLELTCKDGVRCLLLMAESGQGGVTDLQFKYAAAGAKECAYRVICFQRDKLRGVWLDTADPKAFPFLVPGAKCPDAPDGEYPGEVMWTPAQFEAHALPRLLAPTHGWRLRRVYMTVGDDLMEEPESRKADWYTLLWPPAQP